LKEELVLRSSISGTWFADHVWSDEGLDKGSMTRAQFRTWAEKNPGVFSFLDDLRNALRNAENRQKFLAALRIQRWYRFLKSESTKLQSVVNKVRRETAKAHQAPLVVVPLDD